MLVSVVTFVNCAENQIKNILNQSINILSTWSWWLLFFLSW
jgi:hypothetical protein